MQPKYREFLFFNITSLLYILIAIPYLKYLDFEISCFPFAYLLILNFSHFFAIGFLALILYKILSLVSSGYKYRIILAALISSIIAWILYLDTIVYNLYRMHINIFTLELLLAKGGLNIYYLHKSQYAILIAIFILMFSSLFFLAKKIFTYDMNYCPVPKWLMVALVAMAMLTSHFIHGYSFVYNKTDNLRISSLYPLYFPTQNDEFFSKFRFSKFDSLVHKKPHITKVNEANFVYPREQIVAEKSENKNFILILIDSWRYLAFDSITMPNIFKFSEKCQVFENHFSGSNATRSGLFSLFYGIPGIYWESALNNNTRPVFINLLEEKNYLISTFSSASLMNPPFHRTIFWNVNNIDLTALSDAPHYNDNVITQNYIKHLTQNKKASKIPRFDFIFYDAMHSISHPSDFKGPFQPEWEYAKYEFLTNNTNPDKFYNLYKNSAYYVDSLVGMILKVLEKTNELENSIIILTGDHGQEFNDNKKNYWGHNGNYSRAQLHVPLLIYDKNLTPKKYSHWTFHYDVFPSILIDYFNVKNNLSSFSYGAYLYRKSQRKQILVGSSDDFAIISQDDILKIYYSGMYEFTDMKLNRKLDKIEFESVVKVLDSAQKFYIRY